jgi:hypothetical protein
LTAIGQALTAAFTLVLRPFADGNAFGGMIFISLVTGGVMMVLFKLVSNQRAMKEIKAKIGAYFLEMRLYKDDMATVVASEGRILKANLGYMKLAVLPAVVMIIPVVLIMIQLNLRYAHRGLAPGETVMVKVKLAEGVDAVSQKLVLTAGEGLAKASPAVRIPSQGEVDWKVRLLAPGLRAIRLSSDGGEVTVPIVGSTRTTPVYANFGRPSAWGGIANPGAPRIPDAMPIASIAVGYPTTDFNFGLFRLSWLWTFLIISMAFGVILKFVFKVE